MAVNNDNRHTHDRQAEALRETLADARGNLAATSTGRDDKGRLCPCSQNVPLRTVWELMQKMSPDNQWLAAQMVARFFELCPRPWASHGDSEAGPAVQSLAEVKSRLRVVGLEKCEASAPAV